MKSPPVSTFVVVLSACLMALSATRALAGGTPPSAISCSNGALGCKDWHTVPNPRGGSTAVRCSTPFATNYKNYAARAWGCTPTNAIVYNSCDESQYVDDCCLGSNSIGCASLTASCPCPPR